LKGPKAGNEFELRLGGSFSGVEVENLLGLMECLPRPWGPGASGIDKTSLAVPTSDPENLPRCVVCNAPVVSKKQEDLLAATKWLLQARGLFA
jgi:hypothetical protein